MTPLTQPCIDFGELVQDVQESTDRGEGLEQLSSKGLAALLFIRHLGFDMFEVTDKAKADTATARTAFDDKTLVLQNLLYETGYYKKEIQEAADYRSKYSDSEMELMSSEHFLQYAPAEFTAGLNSSADDHDHQLTLRRLDHELHIRKQARQQLSELKMRRDALQTNLGQKRKALKELHKHASKINASTHDIRQLYGLPNTASQQQHESAQLLPLPLYFILSQATAMLGTLSTGGQVEVAGSRDEAEAVLAAEPQSSAQPAHKKLKRTTSSSSMSETDLYQVRTVETSCDAACTVCNHMLPDCAGRDRHGLPPLCCMAA